MTERGECRVLFFVGSNALNRTMSREIPGAVEHVRDRANVVGMTVVGRYDLKKGFRMFIKSLNDYARDLRLGLPNLRYHAARQLIHYRDQGNVCDVLIEALEDPDPLLRREACRTLGGVGKEAGPLLLKALNDPDERVVTEAIYGLSHLGEPEAWSALIQALQAQNPEVRAAAGRALGAFPGVETEKRLLARLNQVQSLAEVMGLMTGLVELRSPDVVMPLTAMFIFADDRTVRDESWRLLTALLGFDADNDDIEEELILQVVRRCLQCLPEEDREAEMEHIAAALKEQNISRYCRLLSEVGIGLVVALRIERGEWNDVVIERISRGDPDDLRGMLPPRVWIAVSLLAGLGEIDRRTEDRRVDPSPADFWLGALSVLSIMFEADREPPPKDEQPSLDYLLDELALSGRLEPRALIRQIADFGDAAVPELEAFIGELESGSAVWWAAKVLGLIGTPKAVDVLIKCLDADDDALSETAGRMLGMLGDDAIEALLDYVDEQAVDDAHGLESAVTALSMIRRPQALAVLIQRAESSNSWVRLAAVRHLVNFGDPVAVPVLQKLYTDEDQDVCFAAGEALLEMAQVHDLDLPELEEIRNKFYGE